MVTKVNELMRQPRGRPRSRIVIEADDRGVIHVEGLDFGPLAKPGVIGISLAATPMDSRTMVLALQKVVMDYTAVMFQGLGNALMEAEGKANGEKNPNDNNG